MALVSSVLAAPARPDSPASGAPQPVQVVIVTLDGTRFQEVFSGVDAELAREQRLPSSSVVTAEQLMPRLHGLMTSGAALGAPGLGAGISASGPDFVSLPGYSEIFSGRRVTDCLNNSCSGVGAPSVVDQLVQQRRTAAIISSWPDIARVASQSNGVFVSTGRHGAPLHDHDPAEAALRALIERSDGPWPGHDDFRRDRSTAELALAYLDAKSPSFLFVGFGETDEFAHQGNYAGYLGALREADRYIGELADALALRARRGARTALFVTADHGRAANFREHGAGYPESARVWLVAAGSAIARRGWYGARREHHLADLAPTVRSLFGLSADSHESAGVSLLPELGPPDP